MSKEPTPCRICGSPKTSRVCDFCQAGADAVATRYLGECQICAQEQKLADGKLVHHGYKRPGDGVIHGDCYGVGAPPYEVSCELLRTFVRTVIEPQFANVRAHLAAIDRGEVRYLTKTAWRGHALHFAACVSAPYVWDSALMYERSETDGHARMLRDELALQRSRIVRWQPAEVRTTEERIAEERAAKAKRAEEREAARAARLAKVAATRAKQAALKEKRDTIVRGFREAFVALAAEPESDDRKEKAERLAAQTKLSKHRFFYARDLGCDAALLTLGLAEHRTAGTSTYVHYRWPF